MASKRKDGFSPSVINPAEFEFVAHHYLGHSEEAWEALCNEMADEAANLEAHQTAHPGFTVAGHKWPGICDCCGARYLYGATFHTATTNTYISVGGTCAGKLSLGSPEAMKLFREQVNTHKIHQERVAKARAYLTKVELTAMLDLYLSSDRSLEFPEVTLRDMCQKVIQWGNELSEKQQAFARKLLQQIVDRPKLLAEREARDEARQPIPVTDNRITIVGTIISAEFRDSGYSPQGYFQPECVKVVIEHTDGWKVWGTLPSELWAAMRTYGEPTWNNGAVVSSGRDVRTSKLKGLKVRLDARVTVSDKDHKFGFFKRPTKAAIITQQEIAE